MANAVPWKDTARLKNKDSIASSIQQVTSCNQVFLELSKYITDHELTSCLELLERRGFSGDVALFILALAQSCGGVA